MELLRQVSNTQFVFTAAAVMVVLLCAALVFVFGFHSAEQPHFGKLPIIIDDRKSSSKKKKIKEKKSSPNRAATDENKAKTENSKKSPAKEKKEDKQKDTDKPKHKERPTEYKPANKELISEPKMGKKNKIDVDKPEDYDDADWQEVPKKNDKKKAKAPEEKDKKESPVKKNKKKNKVAEVEMVNNVEEESSGDKIKIVSAEGPGVNEEAARILQAQVEEFQRVLKEAELRDKGIYHQVDNEPSEDALTEDENADMKDLRSNKKKEQIEKQIKKKATEVNVKNTIIKEAVAADDDASNISNSNQNVPVFDELGDTWNDAKPAKKTKKKARKDQ